MELFTAKTTKPEILCTGSVLIEMFAYAHDWVYSEENCFLTTTTVCFGTLSFLKIQLTVTAHNDRSVPSAESTT